VLIQVREEVVRHCSTESRARVHIAVEILSLDDRLTDVREKLETYRTGGVPDPYSRRMYSCDAGLMEVSCLQVPELNLTLTPADVFG
jgi:hypothetical protein